MAPKTTKAAIKDSLANLSQDKFAEFVEQLLDRREPPKVRRSEVEGKSRLAVTNLLVSTFTESKAPQVVQEILRDIGCSDEADELGKPKGPILKVESLSFCSNEHFVDKYQLELISRVSNVAPILDELLARGIIGEEKYGAIRQIPTCSEKMREIYNCLRAGERCKNIFYEILKDHEKYLMEDLLQNN
uniref:PYD and CARD domain containing n=1 Tax=Echeneis naucrates TaxID=173247 RepID=A0A665TKC4_ECHNA